MADIFLSYSREDQATARQFAGALERAGFSVWWDQTLRSGEAYDEVTERALRSAKAVVVLWSKASAASRWVRAEATIADRAGTLVPVMTEPCDRPVMFELRQSADLSGWQGDAADPRWRAFVEDLRFHRQRVSGDQAAPAGHLQSKPRADEARPSKPVAAKTATALVLVLALIGAGAWALLRHGDSGDAPATASAMAPEARRANPVTLAVLPFDNLSSDTEQEYFADGLTEELLNSLHRISGLQVSGRASAFHFKGQNEDLKAIGEKLGVENLLKGSVRKSGDRLRVFAQLVKARDGFQLWTQTYERSLQDVFAVQEDISRAVAQALQVTLGVGDLGALTGMTRNVQAYEAYLEGRSLRQKATPEAEARAIEQFVLAVEKDPGFVLAWLELKSSYEGAASAETGSRKDALLLQADAAFSRIRQLSDDQRLLQAIDVSRESPVGGWAAIERARPILEALQQDFRQASIVRGAGTLAIQSLAIDKPSRVIPGLERDRTVDPLNSNVSVNLIGAYAFTDRMADAIAELDRAQAATPASQTLAQFGVFLLRGSGDAARLEQAWRKLITLDQRDLTATMFRLRNRPEEARRHLRSLAASPGSAPLIELTQWAAYFKDPELALQFLQADRDPTHRTYIALTAWWPAMTASRRLPGFKELVTRNGLVDYWREFGWGEHCRPVGAADFECH